MMITRCKPYRGQTSKNDWMNRFFEDAPTHAGCGCESLATYTIPTDIYETKDGYVFKFDAPGMAKEDIELEVDGNTLTVSGEKKVDKEVKKETYHRFETSGGAFSRSFTLPKNADATKLDAKLKNGILVLQVPKAEEQKPKTIPIAIA